MLYDARDRILQVNQCVPSLSDVTVVRTDSKRSPAKRDVEAVLRRFVPAIALQLAHHVARNDLHDDVDRIAVNCWSRFFEPASGRLKDAFLARPAQGWAGVANLLNSGIVPVEEGLPVGPHRAREGLQARRSRAEKFGGASTAITSCQN